MVCSVTIAVTGRQQVFGHAEVTTAAVNVLHERADMTGVIVHAYCVMPDHIHLVLSPSATCDIMRFVGEFKNLTQRAAWALGVRGAFWQRSFWDHFVRGDEDLARLLAYVLQNPVRSGLVLHAEDYPFSGVRLST